MDPVNFGELYACSKNDGRSSLLRDSSKIKSRDDTRSLRFTSRRVASRRVASVCAESILSPGPYIYEINHKDKSSMSDRVSHGCQIFSTPGEIAWNAARNARLHNPLE